LLGAKLELNMFLSIGEKQKKLFVGMFFLLANNQADKKVVFSSQFFQKQKPEQNIFIYLPPVLKRTVNEIRYWGISSVG